jgi:hypothetical protein
VKETVMSDYIKGFDDGYSYVLTQIERHPRLTNSEILKMLKGEKVEDAPRILPARLKDKQCD